MNETVIKQRFENVFKEWAQIMKEISDLTDRVKKIERALALMSKTMVEE